MKSTQRALMAFAGVFLAAISIMISFPASAQSRLERAINSGDVSAMRSAIAAGDSANGRTSNGATYLMLLLHNKNFEGARLLLANGADVNPAPFGGMTVLGIAATDGNPHIVEEILAKGADATILDPEGHSVLLDALLNQNGEDTIIAIMSKLIKAGAKDVKCRDHKMTVLQNAEAKGMSKVAGFLRASSESTFDAKAQKAAATSFKMEGAWVMSYTSSNGWLYNGDLLVNKKLENNVFKGTLELSFVHKRTGEPNRVRQNANIKIEGGIVRIECSNPEKLAGSGAYSADTFLMRIVSNNHIEGGSLDAKGTSGTAVLTRN